MDIVFRDFKQAQLVASGPLLSTTITPISPPEDPNRLQKFHAASSSFSIQQDVRYSILHHDNTDARFSKSEGHAWVEVYVAYWKAIGEIIAVSPDWTKVYEAWKEVANALIRGYSSAGFQAWTVPSLYVAGRYLRIFAIKADAGARDKGATVFNGGFQDDLVGDVGKNEKLEDAARLNSIGLSKNILRALQASKTDMPPMESYPKSHIVTFKYYVGVILFLEEDYVKELFGPLGSCIRRGDLAGFDTALAAGENEFVKRRIYLTLERGRDITLRNLLRKVFLVGGFEEAKEDAAPLRRTRIPVEEFAAAIRLGSKSENERLENDEVECLLANMIYKNLMKGYISRERGIVVLSKGGQAFPGTGV
ncbi:MAG: hypothetical protein LQ347_000255 [Umbilicaria vellea]|nr:MAG: hypothetical protein LQ347_000255 [Umbilicaria vellea]